VVKKQNRLIVFKAIKVDVIKKELEKREGKMEADVNHQKRFPQRKLLLN
jgi:hypothetical protein